jgi:methyl-accepting chemotaxis protein
MTANPAARRSLSDFSVRTQILAAVGLASLVALVVGGTGLVALSKTDESAQRITTGSLASIQAVGDVKSAISKARLDAINQVLAPDNAAEQKYATNFAADVKLFGEAMAAYQASQPTADTATLTGIESTWKTYTALVQDELFPLGFADDMTAWIKVRDTKSLPLTTKLGELLATAEKAEKADAVTMAGAAQAQYHRSRILVIGLLAGGLVLAVGLGIFTSRRIMRSLGKVKDVADALAAGDLTHTTGLTSGDEPGQMGRALDSAVQNLRSTVATIEESATSLAGATEEMSSTADHIAASAIEASRQADTVSDSAELVARSVNTVSAGSDEMGAAIREISVNAAQAVQVAADAVSVASATSATMNKLGDSSAEIGNVIKTITAIAEQTNLLALNATIEAARAGEAGKGFAVVASEVKDLAQETARATEDISRRVSAIQADTTGAVIAIEEISQVIARISDFQTTIASAVEEQTATTAEMNRSVGEAAGGTGDIAQNITGVAEATRVTSEGVAQTQQATAELARMSTELRRLVGTFKI